MDKQSTRTQTPTVSCSYCNAKYELTDEVVKRLETKKPNVWQEVIECPHCKERAHVQLVSRGLERKRQSLQRASVLHRKSRTARTQRMLDRVKRNHQQYYDRLQKGWEEICYVQ